MHDSQKNNFHSAKQGTLWYLKKYNKFGVFVGSLEYKDYTTAWITHPGVAIKLGPRKIILEENYYSGIRVDKKLLFYKILVNTNHGLQVGWINEHVAEKLKLYE